MRGDVGHHTVNVWMSGVTQPCTSMSLGGRFVLDTVGTIAPC